MSLVATTLAWLTALSVVALVPIDVYTTLSHQEAPAISTLWSISYWYAAALLPGICCGAGCQVGRHPLPPGCCMCLQVDTGAHLGHHPHPARLLHLRGVHNLGEASLERAACCSTGACSLSSQRWSALGVVSMSIPLCCAGL